MENVGCLLADAKRECSELACSVNRRVRGCMNFEWNSRWCYLHSAEIACICRGSMNRIEWQGVLFLAMTHLNSLFYNLCSYQLSILNIYSHPYV